MQIEVYDASSEEKLLSGHMVSVTQLPGDQDGSDMVIRYYLTKIQKAVPLTAERLPGHADK